MGKYLSNRERFADFFNGVLFGGEQVVDPDILSEETYEIITAFLNIPELWNIREQFRQKNESEEYNMCQAIQELRESERREGKNEGRIEGRIEQMILDNLEENKSKEIIVGKLMRRFALNEEQAETYFDKYAVVMI